MDEVKLLLKESGIRKEQICMMVVACGGVVDRKRGVCMFPIGTKRMNDFPVCEFLRAKLQFSFPIMIDNVGRFLGYAELLEESQDSGCIIYAFHRQRGRLCDREGRTFVRQAWIPGRVWPPSGGDESRPAVRLWKRWLSGEHDVTRILTLHLEKV